MSSLKDTYKLMLIDILQNEGQRIINECVEERGYTHQTKNLYDSYGYGVYDGGVLKRSGFLSATPSATVGKKWYNETLHGREEIQTFLSEYKPKSNGLSLLIAAAMPYGKVLEGRKYQVISMAYNKLQSLANGVKGASVTPLNGGNI